MLPVRYGELVDGEPVIIVRCIEVDHPGLCPGNRTVLAAVLHRHAIDQHPVQRAVTLHQRRRVAAHEFAAGILQRLGRQIRV